MLEIHFVLYWSASIKSGREKKSTFYYLLFKTGTTFKLYETNETIQKRNYVDLKMDFR